MSDTVACRPTDGWAPPGLENLELLGRGGMGEVFRAWDPALRRQVAVKVIRPDAELSGDGEDRFRREATALAGVRHPNVVAIHGFGEHAGRKYLVMEYLPGGSLDQAPPERFPTYRARAELVGAVARGLHAAHAAGVVHRDVKPGNVLLAEDGAPRISDFGLVKKLADSATRQTSTGRILGTPGYLAPEQADGVSRLIDQRADVFALGVVLYELLTGRRPFQAETVADYLLLLLRDDPVAPRTLQPDLPGDLQTICLKCLEKRPARRYLSAAALADDLDRFARGEPIHARPPSLPRRAARWVGRHPALAAVALAVAVALSVLLIQGWWYTRQLDRQLDAALVVADTLADDLVATIKPIAGTQSPQVKRVLKRAESAFGELSRGRPGVKVERRLARLQMGLADVNLELGESADGMARADDAVARYRRLVERFPADSELRLGLARATFLAGRARIETGPLAEAETLLARATDLLGALGADDDLAAERLDAIGWRLVALRKLDRGKEADAAEPALLEARQGLAERPDAKPAWLVRYGASLEKRGDGWYARAESAASPTSAVAEARRYYAQAIARYRQAVAREGWNVRYQERLVEALLSEAETCGLVKEFEELERRVRRIEPRALALHEANPSNRRLARTYMRCRQDLAQALRARGDNPDCLRERRKIYTDVLVLTRRERARDPAALDWPADQANMAYAVGRLSEKLGDWPAAVAGYAESVGGSEALIRRSPDLAEVWSDHVKYVRALAGAHRQRNQPGKARAVLERAAALARSHNRAVVAAGLEKSLSPPR